MNAFFGYIGAVILFFGFISYLIALKRGVYTSNRITWGIWVLVNGLFCLSYYLAVGLVHSIWVPLVYLFSTLVIYIFLFLYSKEGHWSWIERICLVLVFAVLLFWLLFRSPLMTLTFTVVIDILGAIPLVMTVWHDPKSDYGPSWALGFVANVINLFAVEKWDYANAAYPIYLTVLTGTICVCIYVPELFNKKQL